MYRIREASMDDLPGLTRAARLLNSMNLPDDETTVRDTLRRSIASFRGRLKDPMDAVYVFVAEHMPSEDIVGTSMIIAQHGRPGHPHIYYQLFSDERYSKTLSRHFKHTQLALGFSYDGPTELGGLVVHTNHRGVEHQVGRQLSFVRFLFIAMDRGRFRDTLLAELMPPLHADGTSPLWEALGRKFTGLNYQEADRISARNKEFIRSLFPAWPIPATVLPDEARESIGQVGEHTQGVRRMLERIGFRYVDRIDPFDGGPHYEAATEDVTAVRDSRRVIIGEGRLGDAALEGEPIALLGVAPSRGKHRFVAVRTHYLTRGDRVLISRAAAAALGLPTSRKGGVEGWLLPL